MAVSSRRRHAQQFDVLLCLFTPGHAQTAPPPLDAKALLVPASTFVALTFPFPSSGKRDIELDHLVIQLPGQTILGKDRRQGDEGQRDELEAISIVIFHHICASDGPLLATMLVCKAWHTAAILTGEVWSYIHLTTGATHDRLCYGVLKCGTKPQLLAALKRSRGLPLSITDKGTSQFHVQSLIKVIEETVETPRA
ncbi:SubName: Full=Uncharacterized protein {ECO:0000313/EMBL:CCA71328.1} [Serendipita indica DSM 11827]|nr:SubName: Full=Uncharacterized protein {ECO:0000313/EMBL:CCA71328.1} [Serendipita indica DSM 11827]